MKQKVLIVEDEPAIVDNIRYVLETEGFETIWHAEGKGVIELLSSDLISLIVLDIGLPDISGMELSKEIRKSFETPIIFLTARSDEIDKIVGLEIGADDYMVKPFSPRELSARVKAVLRRFQKKSFSHPNNELTSVFSVDQERHQISYFSRKLELSRYEYGLLNLLLSRPGMIFSREHLLERVWDEPDMCTDRTVDAHIKNIRAKLKKVKPDIDPIRTHRSLGYSLKEDL